MNFVCRKMYSSVVMLNRHYKSFPTFGLKLSQIESYILMYCLLLGHMKFCSLFLYQHLNLFSTSIHLFHKTNVTIQREQWHKISCDWCCLTKIWDYTYIQTRVETKSCCQLDHIIWFLSRSGGFDPLYKHMGLTHVWNELIMSLIMWNFIGVWPHGWQNISFVLNQHT